MVVLTLTVGGATLEIGLEVCAPGVQLEIRIADLVPTASATYGTRIDRHGTNLTGTSVLGSIVIIPRFTCETVRNTSNATLDQVGIGNPAVGEVIDLHVIVDVGQIELAIIAPVRNHIKVTDAGVAR